MILFFLPRFPTLLSSRQLTCHLPSLARCPMCATRSNRADPISLSSSVGTIGHVAHGKSQTVKAISGVQTVRFKNELERNITIKLGYANAKVSL